MSNGEIEQKATLSREQLADWLAELATAVRGGGTVEVALAGPPVALDLPEEFRCELEIEPNGDEVELEIEVKWPRSYETRAPEHGERGVRSNDGDPR